MPCVPSGAARRSERSRQRRQEQASAAARTLRRQQAQERQARDEMNASWGHLWFGGSIPAAAAEESERREKGRMPRARVSRRGPSQASGVRGQAQSLMLVDSAALLEKSVALEARHRSLHGFEASFDSSS